MKTASAAKFFATNPSRERRRINLESACALIPPCALGFRTRAPRRSTGTRIASTQRYPYSASTHASNGPLVGMGCARLTVGHSLASARASLFGLPCPRGLLRAQKSCACSRLCSRPPVARFDQTHLYKNTKTAVARVLKRTCYVPTQNSNRALVWISWTLDVLRPPVRRYLGNILLERDDRVLLGDRHFGGKTPEKVRSPDLVQIHEPIVDQGLIHFLRVIRLRKNGEWYRKSTSLCFFLFWRTDSLATHTRIAPPGDGFQGKLHYSGPASVG